jgi:hypothetical protein
MSIGVGISCYNDLRFEYVMTYAPFVNKVFVINGRYSPNAPVRPVNNDMHMLACQPDKFVCVETQDIPERFKRNLYLQLASDYKIGFLLVLDADEYVKCDWHVTSLSIGQLVFNNWHSNVFGVPFYDHELDETTGQHGLPKPRLIWRPKHVRYGKNHYTLINPKGQEYNMPQQYLEGFQIHHDTTHKSHDQIWKDKTYFQWLNRQEPTR